MILDENGLKVTYEDFVNMDFRVGKITACEEVKKSNTLVLYTVELGNGETLSVASSVMNVIDPYTAVGKQVCVLVNLKPLMMGGVQTEGIILTAEDKAGHFAFVVPEGPMDEGAEIC